jgi:hypothetical protein
MLTSRISTSTVLPRYGFNHDIHAGFPGTRQLDGGNWTRNLPSGYSETQGKRKMGIIRGKHECWACLPVRRMKRGFGSTNGLGNYERGFHDELMEVETKFEGGQQLSKEV